MKTPSPLTRRFAVTLSLQERDYMATLRNERAAIPGRSADTRIWSRRIRQSDSLPACRTNGPELSNSVLGGLLAGVSIFRTCTRLAYPVTVAGWLALALYCAVYFAAFAIAIRWASRFTAVWTALFLASSWVLLEYIRGIAFTGFPWLLLSHTQHNFTFFIQSLDIIGAFGLSGIIVFINVLLYEAWKRKQGRHVFLAFIVLGVICTYGFARAGTIRLRPSLHVAAIQAAVPQEMKETLEGKYDPEGVLARYVAQTKGLTAEKLDLIVWPETIFLFPYTLNVNPDALEEDNAKYARIGTEHTSRHCAEVVVRTFWLVRRRTCRQKWDMSPIPCGRRRFRSERGNSATTVPCW